MLNTFVQEDRHSCVTNENVGKEEREQVIFWDD